jgi:hypothetical protein
MKRILVVMLSLMWLESGLLLVLSVIIPGLPSGPYLWIGFNVSIVLVARSFVRSRERALLKPGKGRNQLWLDPDF